MLLYDYVNEELLKQNIASELINVQRHPNLPLDIYTYSRKCVLEQEWNDATIKCRGLIVNRETKEIVARPFQKFFNLNDSTRPETLLENLPKDEPVITEKIDGNLITFWRYGIHWGAASKGSFTSDHAKWATKWLEDHIEEHGPLVFPEGFTPVFEAVCESVQHHVVHYGKDRLVLLALINIETGFESALDRPYALRNHLEYVDEPPIGLDAAINADGPNIEGFVATWHRPGQPPLKVKIKHPTFLKYQKILHKASPKTVLELLKMGDQGTIDNWVTSAPKHIAVVIDQWQGMFKNTYEHLRSMSASILTEALKTCTTRKEFAFFFLEEQNKFFAPVCFAMLDEHKHQEVIWKIIGHSLDNDQMFASAFRSLEIGD